MPTVLRVGPYRFFFWADERQEPPHIHVVAAENEASFGWLLLSCRGTKASGPGS